MTAMTAMTLDLPAECNRLIAIGKLRRSSGQQYAVVFLPRPHLVPPTECGVLLALLQPPQRLLDKMFVAFQLVQVELPGVEASHAGVVCKLL
jgi:hypothetical protein